MKFKVGDRVRIIDVSRIESYELNEIDTIKDGYGDSYVTYIVDMGRPRRPHDESDNETCWWLNGSMIELAPIKGQQLLFQFMEQDA